jgi:hypothetical protein
MFADEARFGRMNRPRPCWAPPSVRPMVASQLIREFIYLYGAVSPMDGACAFLILPAADTECFQIFLDTLGKRFTRQDILLVLDGAPNHPRQHHAGILTTVFTRIESSGKHLGRDPRENL